MNLLLLPLTLWLGNLVVPAPPIELKGYFTCRASLLLPQASQKAALACYAKTQRHCQDGTVILAYEKRLAGSTSRPQYQIADTVQLQVAPTQYLTIARCTTGQRKPTQYFVLCQADALGHKYLRQVLRVWGVNAQGQLVEVPAKTVQCLNADFGA